MNDLDLDNHHDPAMDLNISNLDPSFVQRVCLSILKEDGCFVTSRMLCRRYSALFKVHSVVLAMKKMTTSMDHPHHLGMYRLISERTKVFYKCPPHLVKPSALQLYGIELQDYNDIYYRLPRAKSMNTPNFMSFVENILRANPYGPVPIHQLMYAEPELVKSEPKPPTTYEEWELQGFIMNGEGCFVSSRILQRRMSKRVKTCNITRAMEAMTRPLNSPEHVGCFIKVSERIKIFYKCPPPTINQEALNMYQLTRNKYSQLYYSSPIQSGKGLKNWQNYVQSVARKSPYGFSTFPMESFGFPVDEVDAGDTGSGLVDHDAGFHTENVPPDLDSEADTSLGLDASGTSVPDQDVMAGLATSVPPDTDDYCQRDLVIAEEVEIEVVVQSEQE